MTFSDRLPSTATCTVSAIDFDMAQALLGVSAQPLGVEIVALGKAGRRVLARPVLAALDCPQADTAAMDGYAVATSDLEAGLRRFRVTGACYPGSAIGAALGNGMAARIMTGAAMPDGADRVIILEKTQVDGDFMHILGECPQKLHVRRRGSDFLRGDTLLPVGQVLDPRAMVVAAAADAGEVTVWRRPRVACIASGDELRAPGTASASVNAIPDSLSEAILLFSRQWGAKPGERLRALDNLTGIQQAARALLDECDILVMIGGASRGDRDFARAGLMPLGLEIKFSDLAIKPGKPVWYGRIGERHVLGIPGNPTAAMTIARLFLAPLIARLGGHGDVALSSQKTWLAAPVICGQHEQFLCGYVSGNEIRIIERQSASSQAMLVHAEMLVRIPKGTGDLPVGALVDVYRF